MNRDDIVSGTKRSTPSPPLLTNKSVKRRNITPKQTARTDHTSSELLVNGVENSGQSVMTTAEANTGHTNQSSLVSTATTSATTTTAPTNAHMVKTNGNSLIHEGAVPGSRVDLLATLRRRAMPAIAPTVGSIRSTGSTVRNVPSFLNKLYGMVNDESSNHLIRWSDSNTSFIVTRHEDFAREVLPRFFKHGNFSSFVRQLNMYGFNKVPHIQQGVLAADSEDAEQWEFMNPNFRRDQPDLLYLVQRKRGRVLSEIQAASTSSSGSGNISGDSNNGDAANGGNFSGNRSIDLHHVLQELAAVKKHQLAISEDLREIQYENRQLWSEAVAARERHERQQDTIDNILQFLASVFTSEKRRRGIYSRGGNGGGNGNGGRRRLLLGDRNTQYSDDEADIDGVYGLDGPSSEASAILDEFNRQRRNRSKANNTSSRHLSSEAISDSISDVIKRHTNKRAEHSTVNSEKNPLLPNTTGNHDYTNATNAVANANPFPTPLTDNQLKLLNQWLLANMAAPLPATQNTLNDYALLDAAANANSNTNGAIAPSPAAVDNNTSTIPDLLSNPADQMALVNNANAFTPSFDNILGTGDLLANSTQTSPLSELLPNVITPAPTATTTATATTTDNITGNNSSAAIPTSTEPDIASITAAIQNAASINNATQAPVSTIANYDKAFAPELLPSVQRTQEINTELNQLDSSILALVKQLGLDPTTGKPYQLPNDVHHGTSSATTTNITPNMQPHPSPLSPDLLLPTMNQDANLPINTNSTNPNATVAYNEEEEEDNMDLSQFLQVLESSNQDQLFDLLPNMTKDTLSNITTGDNHTSNANKEAFTNSIDTNKK